MLKNKKLKLNNEKFIFLEKISLDIFGLIKDFLIPNDRKKILILSKNFKNYNNIIKNYIKKLDIVISIDITSSMKEYLYYIKKIKKVIIKLSNITDTNISLILFKDHCDKELMKFINFTKNYRYINYFINNIEPMGGGDIPEAIEDVLNKINNQKFRIDSEKFIILITDSYPHGYKNCTDSDEELIDDKCPFNIDWEYEVNELVEKKIKLLFIECDNYNNKFKNDIVDKFKGSIININNTEKIYENISNNL